MIDAMLRAGLAVVLCTSAPMAAAAAVAAAEPARTLTREFLFGSAPLEAPVPTGEFAPSTQASAPIAGFTGRLILSRDRTNRGLHVIRDDYGTARAAADNLQSLPPFDFELVADGDNLIPVLRGPVRSAHPLWEFVVEPGRLWSEPGDGGYTRAALPFSLTERNANCTHNGLMTFLFNGHGEISRVAYQMGSETCLYLKFDLWGTLPAKLRAQAVPTAARVITDYRGDVARRLLTRPIGDLARDFPGADPSGFANPAEVAPEDMTLFGLVVDGVHYVGGCQTRHGPHPYCDVVDLPSYSLAKSLVAGLGSLALAREFPELLDEHIADYVPECWRAGGWADVRFRDALDMATGHYGSSLYDEDEKSGAMIDFFLAEDHRTKIRFACSHFPRKSAPGKIWVYHTIDTYVLGTALEAFVKKNRGKDADFYDDVLIERLWKPLGLSPVTHSTRRTRDASAQAFTGWGLTLQRDDIARLGQFLAAPGTPRIDGKAVLDEREAAIALQRDPNDRGLAALDGSFRYARGFWAHEISRYIGCPEPVWVPYMVGFGGLTVLLMPNGLVYYYVSDGGAYRWARAAAEAHRIRPMCHV